MRQKSTFAIRRTLARITWCIGCCLLLSCRSPSQPANEITVFAAASLQNVLRDVGKALEQQHRITLSLNTAGSGSLAKQILAGAGADVYISANAKWIGVLEQHEALVPDSKFELLTNHLVVIAHAESAWQLDAIEALPKLPFRHLCIGQPESVPAGDYARTFLQSQLPKGETIWDSVTDRIATTNDVRRVVSLVAADRMNLGIVYATDVNASSTVRVLHEIPAKRVAVAYWASLVRRNESPDGNEAAKQFCLFLQSDAAKEIYLRHGFELSASQR